MRAFLAAIAAIVSILVGPVPSASASPAADIAVGLSAAPTGVFTRTVTFTVTLTNLGPDRSERTSVAWAVFWDPPDLDVELPPGCNRQAFLAVCTTGALRPGASTQFALKASGAFTGEWRTADVTFRLWDATPADPNPSNNHASVPCTFGGGFSLICHAGVR